MSTFMVTDPVSGRTVKLTGDSPPTEEELEEIFASFPPLDPNSDLVRSGSSMEEPKKPRGILDLNSAELMTGVAETAASVGTAMVAEPFAGAFGVGSALTEGDVSGGGTQVGDAVRSARQAMTYKPRSEGGMVVSEALGAGFEATGIPAGLQAAEKMLGDLGYNLFGPVGGAVGASVPTAALEAIGLVGITKLRGAKKIKGIPDSVADQLQREGIDINDVSEVNITRIQDAAGQQLLKEQDRISAFEDLGMTPTKAQVTRNADDFQAQQEAAKTDTPVRAELEYQEGVLNKALDDLAAGTGGKPVSAESSVTNTIVSRSTNLTDEITALYKEADEIAGGAKNIKPVRLGKKLKDLARSDRRAGGNVEAVFGDLQAKGVIDADFNVVGKIDAKTADDVRKLLSELYSNQNPFGNKVLRELKDELDADVLIQAGTDIYKRARKANADYEGGLRKAKADKFDATKTNLVRDVLERKVNPETLAKDVSRSKTYRTSDIQQLKTYLNQTPDGKVAWNDLRAEVLNDIKERAFKGPEDAEGVKAVTRDRLERALDSVGEGKLNVLFSKEEVAFLEKMKKVVKLREPVRMTQQGLGPSGQLLKAAEKSVLNNPMLNDFYKAITNSISEGMRSREALTIPSSKVNVRPAIRGSAAAAGTLLPASIREKDETSR